MQVKNGADHLKALDRDVEIFLDGEVINRVAVHPAFRNSCLSTAKMYDFQADPANIELMTYDIGNGRRANKAWQQATCYDELIGRREAMTAWAELNGGFMGRSPDHLASAISAQVMGLDVFREHGEKYAKAYWGYYEYARDRDLFLTYVIINPQVDRSKNLGQQKSEDVALHIVDEDREGVTVRGAKMLGTSAIMAEEIFVANLQPLQPGEEKFAISFAVPLNSKGIKIISRKSYEKSAVSEFDNPLSHRFDENDAVIYFDDVKVPWDRVFLFMDTEMCARQFHATPGHIMQNYQSQVRWNVKMKFLLGVARRITETIGTIKIPAVKEKLGRMAAEISAAEGMLWGMEAKGTMYGDYYVVDRNLLYAAQVYTQKCYPRFINDIRELAGGGLIMLPSSAPDLARPEVAEYLNSTQISAREGEGSYDRIKFMKLAWDAIGSEFASRHVQYEMFYAGAHFVTAGHSFRTYDWATPDRLVTNILKGNDTDYAIKNKIAIK